MLLEIKKNNAKQQKTINFFRLFFSEMNHNEAILWNEKFVMIRQNHTFLKMIKKKRIFKPEKNNLYDYGGFCQ